MDEKAIEAAGTAPLKADLERIAGMHSKRDIAKVAASMPNRGALFDFESDQDFKNSTQVIAELDQDGLGLPDRDYYVKTDPKSVELRQALRGACAEDVRAAGRLAGRRCNRCAGRDAD